MGDNIDIDNQNKIKEQFNNIFKNSPLPKVSLYLYICV